MNPKPPVFVFDFGGVLMDWDPRYLYRKFFNDDSQTMERFLAEIDFYNWNMQQDAGRSFAEAVDTLSARFPDYANLIKAYDERWEESLGGPIQSNVELLRQIKARGYQIFGLSNWSSEKFRIVRDKYPFFEWFEDIIISGEVGLVKPDPLIFNLLLDRVRRPAADCLLIDDSPANIEAANSLGFQTILVGSPDKLAASLQPYLNGIQH